MQKHAQPPTVWKKATEGNRNRLKKGTMDGEKRATKLLQKLFEEIWENNGAGLRVAGAP